jgi:hypothetical protein
MSSVYEVIFDYLKLWWPGILVGCVVIAAAHLGLWEAKLKRHTAYVVGSLCVISGQLVSASLTGNWEALLFHLAHLIPCGAVILFAWMIRGTQEAQTVAVDDADKIREAARSERTG